MTMPNEQDELLAKVVVDVLRREIHLYSDNGFEKHVQCDNYEQFMNVLDVCRKLLDEDTITYVDPIKA